jgi:hypothetical protein
MPKQITDLTIKDIVIFYNEKNECFDGNIISIKENKANIIYLRGYKTEYATIPFEKIKAYVDVENGTWQKIEEYSGYFVKL